MPWLSSARHKSSKPVKTRRIPTDSFRSPAAKAHFARIRHNHVSELRSRRSHSPRPWAELSDLLKILDGKPYVYYKSELAEWRWTNSNPPFVLSFERIQSEPDSQPSSLSIKTGLIHDKFPEVLKKPDVWKTALADAVTRKTLEFLKERQATVKRRDEREFLKIYPPSQNILARTCCTIDNNSKTTELRLRIRLPAHAVNKPHRISIARAHEYIVNILPTLVKTCLTRENFEPTALERHLSTAMQSEHLRSQLSKRNLVAFVANGAVLPRQSRVYDKPLEGPRVVFQSPPELEVTLDLPNSPSKITGMGIPKGVTVITGGSFHGKSTLLEALQYGIYNHVPGDGREFVVSDAAALKINAKSGRAVTGVDISPFVSKLPSGGDAKDPHRFSTSDATTSESMAAAIQEALEVGASTLLIDEDSSAVNLLVRDTCMKSFIPEEPVTPLVSRARALFQERGVSTIVAVSGLGDWLEIADNVICMDEYRPKLLNERVRDVFAQAPRHTEQHNSYGKIQNRVLHFPANVPKMQLTVEGKDSIAFVFMERNLVRQKHALGRGESMTRKNAMPTYPTGRNAALDITDVEQLVEKGQTRLVAQILLHLSEMGSLRSLRKELDTLEKRFKSQGLGWPCRGRSRTGIVMASVRPMEVAAVLSRLRDLGLSDRPSAASKTDTAGDKTTGRSQST